MPKGSVHAKATLALAAAGGYITYQAGHPWTQVLALAGGVLAGLLLTPDLDVDDGCISNAVVRRSFGKRLERLWRLFWRPYALLIPHRSRLSHLPLLGTALRLAYLATLPALALFFASASPAAGGIVSSPTFPAWTAWSVGGLTLADTLHFLMDEIF